MTNQTKTSILLHNGDFFDFQDPFNHEFDIESIATALSNLCRYTGHVTRFYSVAEHCYLVSLLVPEQFALEGLMHDASEAFCGDVSSPLKQLLPDYKYIEENVQEAIARYYNLQYPFPPCIKEADKIAYVTERKTVGDTGIDALWHTNVKPDKIKVVGYTPATARKLFINRFRSLYNDRNAVLRSKAEAGTEAA